MERRRQMAAGALVLCLMAFYTSPAVSRTTAGTGATEPLTNEDFLRFHVIGNSDSEEDQGLKLQVRDGLLEEIHRELAVYTVGQAEPVEGPVELTQEETREFVRDHLKEIEDSGERIVKTLGYDYPVTAKLEVCQIPEKTYGNVTFPAGQYEALNVTIGKGRGQNWWCVLFPPLCLVGAEENFMDTDGNSLEEKYDPLMEAVSGDTPVKLQLKFKTLEILESLEEHELRKVPFK